MNLIMLKRLFLIIMLTMCSRFVSAHTPANTIKWGVPLEYRLQANDGVSNTAIVPRGKQQASAPTPPPPPHLPTEPEEDLATTEERLNSEVRILWDEIERAEKQQQQANDIKVLPINKKPLDPEKVFSKTPPKPIKNKPAPVKTPPNAIANQIKNEKERIDTLLRTQKDKDGVKTTTSIAKDKEMVKDKDKNKVNDKNSKTAKSTKTTPASPPVVVVPPTITAQPKPVLTRKQVLEEEIAREKAALKSAKSQLLIAQKRGNMAQIQKLHNMIRDRELNVQAISRELSR